MKIPAVTWLGPLLALGLMYCSVDAPRGPVGRLAVDVAPLTLPGITDAEYVLTVHNGPGGTGDVVWTKAVSSQGYGDGAGSLSYVGTCDAETGTNTVTLELTALYDASGEVSTASYMNPTPIRRDVACVANTDVAVQFDIALARRAEQGFFDVAVQFKDLFCSAKLDCEKADHSDLELLHAPSGARDMTVVLGFACTGSLTGSTYLYMDNVVVACAGLAQDVIVAPTGLGNVTPLANADGYLFGAAVYRGVEGLAGKAYWNVSLGLDATTFATAGACTLTTRATASDTPFPQEPAGFPLPAGTVYPVIGWSVPLSDATHRVCTQHEVDAGPEVATTYEGYLPLANGFTWAAGPIYLQNRFQPVHPSSPNGEVLSAGTPICNPGCDHGVCVSLGEVNQCECAGTGYEGATCATPVCTAPCVHGTCVAPDTCDCAGTGYEGATCATDVDECLTDHGGCDVDARCTNTDGARLCECAPGFTGDGATCTACADGAVKATYGADACTTCGAGTYDAGDDEVCDTCSATCAAGTWESTACTATSDRACTTCTDVAGCVVQETCTSASDSVCATCQSGYTQLSAGAACTNVNECLTGNGGCDANARCTDTDGSRLCECAPGFTGDGTTCTACAAGAVKTTYGTDACTTCGAGTYDAGDDEVCDTCSATCAAGTWESTACTATTNRACTTCTDVAGCTVQETCTSASDSVCATCQSGYTQLSAGAACTDVNECLTGNGGCDANARCTNTDGSRLCECDPGYTGDGTTCTACAVGAVKASYGADACTACVAGTYDEGDETCAACASGYVQPLAGQTSCTVCPVGTRDIGTEVCQACSSGYVQPLEGQTFCTACPVGTYDFGDDTCQPCPLGQVQPSAGMGSCTSCQGDTYDAGNDEVCDACAATCAAGTWESTACTATTNRACTTCTDISGCTVQETCTSASNSVCTTCITGYTQVSAGVACTDINECLTNNGGCSSNATCTNTAGSRTCACYGGVTYGDGVTCSYPVSCLTLRAGGDATSGTRWIDPDGASAAQASQVYCDMTTDGGGYTFYKSLQASAYTAAQAEVLCDTFGMQLFIPRTPAHFTASWSVAQSTTYGPSASDQYLRIMGIYPSYNGATCNYTPLRSGNPSCGWVASDGGNFFVSNSTTAVEPNGNNNVTMSMYYNFDASGNPVYWDDLTSTVPASTRFMCDVADKRGYPASCKDWRALAYTTSGNYTIDPDGNGPNAALTVYCDMVTDGGGWTLIGRSAPRTPAGTGCSGGPANGSFGWKYARGSLADDANPYSLNVLAAGVPFSQVLFGDFSTGKLWGDNIYRHDNLPSDYLTNSAWLAASYNIGGSVAVDATCTPAAGQPSMFNYMGFTDEQAFHFRDNTGAGYGLTIDGWYSCYYDYCERGGNIDGKQGMIMVR